jgi:hypothetical protein
VPAARDAIEGIFSANHPDGVRIPMRIGKAGNTNLVQMKSNGPAGLAELHMQFHELIVDLLVNDQRAEYEVERQRLQRQLEQERLKLEELEDERVQRAERLRLENVVAEARAELEDLKDKERLLSDQLATLEVEESLTKDQLETLEAHIEAARASRAEATGQASSGPDGLTLMLLGESLQNDIERQAVLEDRLMLKIPRERSRISADLNENRRQQEVQAERISLREAELEKLGVDQDREIARQRPLVEQLESQFETFHMTRPVAPPRRSDVPTDTGSRNLMALYGIAGVVIGLMLAGFFALGQQVAKRARSGNY